MQNRNLKQQQIQQENQKAQLLNYLQGQDKTSADYINMITSTEGNRTQKLEAMVRAQLRKEFPGIENKKSYEFLVSAVMHNYQKKQLQAMD